MDPVAGGSLSRPARTQVIANVSRSEASMDSVAKFAGEAATFERWLLSGTDRGPDAARECLIRLLEL